MSLRVADCLTTPHVIYYIYQANGLSLYPKEGQTKMIRLIDNNNSKAIEADCEHYTCAERLSFDNRDKGGFARWEIEFTAPNRKGERMRLFITSGHLYQHLFKRAAVS